MTKVEGHLAGCRDCRALVAALAGDEVDSQAQTHKHERVSESQAGPRPTKQLAVGDRVGRYLVLSKLGSGGMGVVFAAYDPKLDRKVALKLLRANLGANAKEARTRLQREAQAIAQLNHPNVVGVYDVGTTDDGDVYLAMEFVEGDTLTTWLKRWPRTWREILDIFMQAGRGLYAAHSVGLLHRDFKPDNVLVGGDGRVRVSDFGLARSLLTPEDIKPRGSATPLNADLTATGTVLGTPRYMPPEQLTGPDIDARSDQFSFCVALYEALYGTHPLPGATSVGMLEKGERAFPPPEGLRVPPAIARAVMRGLEKERMKRFPTMAALLAELQPPPERSPVRFVAMAVAGLVLVGGATAAVVSRPDPVRQDPQEDQLKALLKRIDGLEKERDELRQRLVQKPTLQDLQDLKGRLEEKDNEIHDLVDQITQLKADEAKQKRPVRPAIPNPDEQIRAALDTIQRDLEGCFNEWAERPATAAIGSAKLAAPKEVDLLLELEVTPDGKGHTAKLKSGTTDTGLKFCVEAAIERVPYPPSDELRTLQLEVMWQPPGLVITSGRIIGRREAPKAGIDE